MKILYHLGLGDHIATAALVAYYARTHETVQIPCYDHNYDSVKSFFVNLPNVEIVKVKDDEDALAWGKDAEVTIGMYDRDGSFQYADHEDFVQWFYRCAAGMKMCEKPRFCPLRIASKKVPQIQMALGPETDFQFIHDDRGFSVDHKHLNQNLYQFRPSKADDTILRYAKLIHQAKEIHCIDSSFLHLVEALPTTGKLFYHQYARPNSPSYRYLKKEWTVLNKLKHP